MIDKGEKIKRALLWLPAKLYELAVRVRVAAYETQYRKPKRLNAVVIAVGNITVGGTGKTPMVARIASYIKSEDHSVAILTRGYGRESPGMRPLNAGRASSSGATGDAVKAGSYREFGDEPLMLA